MEKLLEELKRICKEVDFDNETALIDDGLLTSFEIVTIVAMIEEVFDVKVPASKLRPSNFNDVESMWKLIQELQDED